MNLRDCKRRAAGGKRYWAEGARVLGVTQTEDGLRFLNEGGSMPQVTASVSAAILAASKKASSEF
jgi:hypothetical protein